MNRSPVLMLALLVASAVPGRAEVHAREASAGPSGEFVIERRELSPRSDLAVEAYINRRTLERQIWIAPVAAPGHRKLLYQHQRHASVLFSHDQTRLAITDFPTTSGGGPLLYRIGPGLTFTPELGHDIEEEALAYLAREHGVRLEPPYTNLHQVYDKFRASAIAWSPDGSALLLELNARGARGTHPANGLRCVYDLRARRVTRRFAAFGSDPTLR